MARILSSPHMIATLATKLFGTIHSLWAIMYGDTMAKVRKMTVDRFKEVSIYKSREKESKLIK